MKWIANTPARVWLICAFFALLQPLTHGLVMYCAPDDAVPTGLHKPDSAIFIHAMRMFETGFYSPYATCQSPFGDHSWRLFTTPFYLLYGVVGPFGSLLSIGEFAMLGIANGFGAACYLLAVYHFMLTVMPAHAKRAFPFFTFSGGLGGILYVVCFALGHTGSPSFSQWFYRFAIYDLVEGQYLAPYLLMPRLYYTLPLALGYAGLTSVVVSWRIRCPIHLAYSQVLLFAGTVLNARLGPPLGLIAVLYLAQTRAIGWRTVLQIALPLLAGVGIASQIMRLNPGFVENVYAVVQQQMWFSSYLSAGFPLLALSIPVVLFDSKKLRGVFRWASYGGLGYILVFSLLFVFYQIYYGTLLIGADHAASVRVSDVSLLGAAIGLVWCARTRSARDDLEHGWLIVWVVLFTAAAISAFCQGWFLRFAPQRLMVFLGIPLSLLAAQCVSRMEAARPRLASMCVAMVYSIGLPALAVSTLVFQGPLGMRPGIASEIGMHAAYVRRADAACLDELPPGIVAAPWPYNDILSVRDGVKVIGGYGAVGLSDQGSGKLDDEVKRFFSPGVSDDVRVEFLDKWCVDYVYLPSDARARDALESELDSLFAIQRMDEVDGAVLYAVKRTDRAPASFS